MMTKQDLMSFFAWADENGMAFGEFVESRDQTWFHEKVGARLEEVVESFLRQKSVPPMPDYKPFGDETSVWWTGTDTREAV